MKDWINKCDRGFNQYHKTDLVTGRAIHKRTERFIQMQENCRDIPDKVLKLFVKERTFHDKVVEAIFLLTFAQVFFCLHYYCSS